MGRLVWLMALVAASTSAQELTVLEVIESDEPVATLDLGEQLVRGLGQSWRGLAPSLVVPDSGGVVDERGAVFWDVPAYAVDRFSATIQDGRIVSVTLDFSTAGPNFSDYAMSLLTRHGRPQADGFYPAAVTGHPFDLLVHPVHGALVFRAVPGNVVSADEPLPIQFRPAGTESRDTASRPAPPPRDTTIVYATVDAPPEVVGGMRALSEALEYPPDALADGVQGRVIVQCIVHLDGKTSGHTVLRSPDDRLSAAAIEAVRSLRFWPGHQAGLPVQTRLAIPVRFQIPG